jgi:hypothetical protein
VTARRLSKLAASAMFALAASTLHPTGADAADTWGPFRGRIVDMDTGAPIPGVAVLVVWWELVPNPVQGQRRFFDARETITDVQGRFEVPRLSAPLFGFRIPSPEVILFAPGYVEASETVTPAPPKGQPFLDATEIRMRRLKTRQELREKSRSRPSSVPDDKMPGLIRAINIERSMLELDSIGPTPGKLE